MERREANRIGHILRWNCLLKQVTEGKIEGRIEVTERRRRRLMQLPDDLKETGGYRKLMGEALDLIVRRTGFERGRQQGAFPERKMRVRVELVSLWQLYSALAGG
jgi:hypothetical protein